MKLLRDLWRDECGFILSTELLMIATIVVVGLMAGFVVLRDAALGELADVAGAVGGLNQSYCYPGVWYSGVAHACGVAFTSGGSFWDRSDACDRQHGHHHPGCGHHHPGCGHCDCGCQCSCGSISIAHTEI